MVGAGFAVVAFLIAAIAVRGADSEAMKGAEATPVAA